MIPVTYYPLSMQKQLVKAKATLADSPYSPFVNERVLVPENHALKIQKGPLAPDAAIVPSIKALNEILDLPPGTERVGYTVLEGPTLYVQSHVQFPGSTPEMFKWWFWWEALDSRRYMIWFPHSHISLEAEDPVRLADPTKTFEERFYENRQHVVELMGPDLFESVIRFTDPTVLGFDLAKLKKAGIEGSASGLLEVPGLRDVTVGVMVHLVRSIPGGMELISRYWLGSHPELARFPGANKAPEILAGAGMNAEKMEQVAYELAVHDMTEWHNLASILPKVYERFGTEAPPAKP